MAKIRKTSRELRKRTLLFAVLKNGNIYQEDGEVKKFFNQFICIFLIKST